MNIAFYRLPYSDVYSRISCEGSPLVLNSYEELDNLSGFVIAPFLISERTPLVLLPFDGIVCENKTVNTVDMRNDACRVLGEEEDRMTYSSDFVKFHDAVAEGRFAKLVLSRSKRVTMEKIPDLEDLFLYFCNTYPRAMVMLFSTELTGTWLVASPEILVESQQPGLCTIALAGTMPFCEGLPQWSEKNKHEQHIVEKYIEETIAPLSDRVIKYGPRSVRAGSLMHLRTDFRFQPSEGVTIGNIVASLHPTPAVCGMPKSEAREFVLRHESNDRRYYSGFAGPLNMDVGTHLFVSLRCMTIEGNCLTVYAGGGIMPDSNARDEWRETEMKMINF